MADQSPRAEKHSAGSLWTVAIAALGVVYGDIGTSPLYALRECFFGPSAVPLTPETVYGLLSVLFWILVLIVSIKYMIFVLSADNRGEGGILALTALAVPRGTSRSSIWLIMGLFGAAL